MVYLVDLENIPYAWAEYFNGATADDEFILFYGRVCPAHLSFALLQALMEGPAKVRCVPCYDGDNAMDFQLCSELGFHIAQNGSCSYAIVSKDTGYDPVVKHWRDLGVSIKRVVPQVSGEKALKAIFPKTYLSVLTTPSPAKKKSAPAAPAKPPAPANKTAKAPAKPPTPPKKVKSKKPPATAYHEALKKANSGIPGPALQSISTMMEKSLSMDANQRMFNIYSMMCQKFKKDGRPYYNKLKPVISMVTEEPGSVAKAG